MCLLHFSDFKVLKKLCLNGFHFLSMQVGTSKTVCLKQVLCSDCFVRVLICFMPVHPGFVWVDLLIDVQYVTSLWQLLHFFIYTFTASAFRGINLLLFLLLNMEILLKKVVKCPDIFSTDWLEFFTTSLASSRFSQQGFSSVCRRSIFLEFWGGKWKCAKFI